MSNHLTTKAERPLNPKNKTKYLFKLQIDHEFYPLLLAVSRGVSRWSRIQGVWNPCEMFVRLVKYVKKMNINKSLMCFLKFFCHPLPRTNSFVTLPPKRNIDTALLLTHLMYYSALIQLIWSSINYNLTNTIQHFKLYFERIPTHLRLSCYKWDQKVSTVCKWKVGFLCVRPPHQKEQITWGIKGIRV